MAQGTPSGGMLSRAWLCVVQGEFYPLGPAHFADFVDRATAEEYWKNWFLDGGNGEVPEFGVCVPSGERIIEGGG